MDMTGHEWFGRIVSLSHWCLRDSYVVYVAVLTEWKNYQNPVNHDMICHFHKN